jgi:serine protease
VPQGSSCAESETPVFRAYNNRWPQNDSNHRYTADTGVYAQMTALGWAGEGVVFCAPR